VLLNNRVEEEDNDDENDSSARPFVVSLLIDVGETDWEKNADVLIAP
jgi:hypothetical protein